MAAKATKAGNAGSAAKAGNATRASRAGDATRAEGADEKPPAAKKGAPAAKKTVRPEPAPAPAAAGDSGRSAEELASAEEPASAEEFVPMNRAERRAKARGKSIVPPPSGRGKVSGSHGPAHTFRNWANRRTG
ncbi:MAG: hypothetical protein IRY85_22465 [Micromonosporaceae bacterium]|nr:hypothetical protein [Micromonosporaceae bacterium]